MNITPIAGTKNRVFIKESTEEKVTSGGIILMEDAEKAPTEGIVVGVSERDETGMEPNVKVGDYVYFPENAPYPIQIGEETFLVLKENQIYAKRTS